MWEKELRLKFGKYVSLNVIAMMGLSCYILADTFFVANGVGVQGLTALNLVIPIYSFINGVGLMLGIGGATKYAINRAQGNELGGNEVFSKAVRLGIAAGILFLVLGVFGAGKISTMLGADESIWELANVYVKTIMCFSPAFIMNNICVAFVRNDGEPNLAMQAMLSGSIANIILDYLFIYPLNLGMFGAAFATGFAPIISMIMVSKHLRNGHNNFHLVKSSKSYWKTIVSLGSASFITEASSGIVIIVFNIVILKLEGNLGVAAYGVVANLALVATALFTGIAQGVQPLVSENYGKRQAAQMKRLLRYAFITVLMAALILYIIVGGFAGTIVSAFNSEKSTQLSELATLGLRIYFIGFFFAGLNILFASWFGAVEQPMQSALISILRGGAILIPLLLGLAALRGIQGVWLCYPITEFLTLCFVFFVGRKAMKRTLKQ